MNKYQTVKEMPDICPVCGEPSIMWCRCMIRHSSCKNGHEYHIASSPDKELIKGRWHVINSWFYWMIDKE